MLNVLNHVTFKLSDLDLEMMKHVPQGGNWKNIPDYIVNKSKRLQNIKEHGGRTTFYGRLDYNNPSYTITTYFNRPGNGTNVHPVKERVLSVREAARLQTFPDDYFFCGSKTSLLKQVGNAVPPIMSYQIAQSIKKQVEIKNGIDLFCGAGGFTCGFERAGIRTVLGVDIDNKAIETFKTNNPNSQIICGDITKKEIKDEIIHIAKNDEIDIICGGPPCQGFSMAGFRDENDPRNKLVLDFIEIVEKIKPKVVVFENVKGLLSYKKGETYREIHSLFDKIGYKTCGIVLPFEEYGVPQKRHRVIVICVNKDLNIDPYQLFPPTINHELKHKVTVRDAIKDLEDVPCSENAVYDLKEKESLLVKTLKNKISFEDYLKGIYAKG